MPNTVFGYLRTLPRFVVRGAAALALLPALGGEVRAQEIMSTEFFDIALVHDYTEMWRDSGSRAKRDVVVMRPVLPSGFSTLGDVAIDGKMEDIGVANLPYTIAIRAKPGYEKLLVRPTGVVEKWSTDGTRANVHMKVYGLVCPTGYITLGGYVQKNSDTLGNTDIRCISTSVLTRGIWAVESVWDDKGTGADKDLSLWTAEYRGPGKRATLIIPANSFVASTTHDKPLEQPWVLQLTHTGQDIFADLPADQVKSADPTLTGPHRPTTPEAELPPVEYQLPFYQVQDPDLSFFEQWRQSPVYTVRRTTRYEFVDMRDNTGNCETGEAANFSYQVTVGTERNDSWSVEVGLSVTVEGKAGFKPLGVGGEVSVAVNAGVTHGTHWGVTDSKSNSVTDEIPVPAGTAMAVYKLNSEYRVYRQGSDVPIANAAASHASPMLAWAYYRLPGWTKENGCPRADVLASGPAELVKGQKYYSKSGAHYLMWDDKDFAVYTDGGNPIWKFGDVQEYVSPILSIAISEDGQITVVAGRKVEQPHGNSTSRTYIVQDHRYTLVQNTNRPKGTALYLTEDGALQVVAPTGRVVWDSSK